MRVVPWIFIKVLGFVDRKLGLGLNNLVVNGVLGPPTKRCFYNYIILNGRKLSSLMARCSGLVLGEHEQSFEDFKLFKSCIFYLGKGINSRKEVHFKQAKRCLLGLVPVSELNEQVLAIYNCWLEGGSVVLMQVENESTSFESFCREAAMIETIGLEDLDNSISGSKYGEMVTWPSVQVKNYGELTLFVAFRNFILKPPPSIKAGDVHIRPISKKKKIPFACKRCGFSETICT